jgi:hypothetical protein
MHHNAIENPNRENNLVMALFLFTSAINKDKDELNKNVNSRR